MADPITITSGALTAAIDPLGAELVSLKDADGRELMTNADPAFWTGHAPILFPIVGQVEDETIRVDGAAYHLPKHGFARRSTFAVTAQAAGSVTFRLEATNATRAHYPFAFVLEIAFTLTDVTLAVDVTIANPDETRALPASFGFHPAFAWPLPYGAPRADHAITFDADEPEPLRVLEGQGTIAPQTRQSPLADARTLHLADALFTADALIWDAVRAQSVTYGAPGAPHLRVDFPDTPMLGIWTKPGAAYVCIEPWHGIADPTGYADEFRDKPGVFEVAPGGTKQISMRITLDR